MPITDNNPQDHNYHSVRQAARLLGQSTRTINNWIDGRKIAYLQIDNIRIIHQDAIDDIKIKGVEHAPKYKLAEHVTVSQAARALNINFQNLKRYVKEERIQNIKKDGVYFIPVSEIKAWLQIAEPRNPNTVEAHKFGALLIKDAALALGISNSYCRALILSSELKAVEGYCRRYVLNSSIAAYKEVKKGLDSL